MDTALHNVNEYKIAEIVSDDILINNLQDALDLIADISYQEIDRIVLRENNFAPDFYNLRSGLAGEIFQKCVNYGMKLAIIGDFDKYESKSFKAFLIESNRGNQFFFVPDIETAKQMLSKK